MLGLDHRPGDALAISANVLDLVRRPLPDRMLGDFRTHRHPIESGRQLDAAIRLDRQQVSGRVELVDQVGVELQTGLAAGEDHPLTAGRERAELGDDLLPGHAAAGGEFRVAVEPVRLARTRLVAL